MPDRDPSRRRHGDPPGDAGQDGIGKLGAASGGDGSGHEVASLCRWKRAPRSQSRRACQWMSPMVVWVTNGWRRSSRSTIRSRQAPPDQVEAGVEQEAVAGILVDGDAQPGRLVADPDRVAAGHLDERRDVEGLVHRVDQGRRIRRAEQAVEVPLTVRVVHLDDDGPEVAGRIPAQEEAGRVEGIADDPEVRDEGHLPARRVEALADR